MYAVVGCTDCGNYWLLADPDGQDSATCTRCGTRHRVERLRRFHESAERADAAEARAKLLADKRGESASFDRVESVRDLEREVDSAGPAVGDDEYLGAAGLDPEAVANAGESDGGGSRSREEILRGALRAGNRTEAEILAYASDRGVPREAARDLLERLTRRGEATESGGEYRLL